MRLVTVSRKLVKGAPINVRVHHEPDDDGDMAVGASMSLDDFVMALAAEMKHPLPIATRAQLRAALQSAAATVVAAAKHETQQAV